jgi:hypothetical protein
MKRDVTVVFEPFDESAGWPAYTGPLTKEIQVLMDTFTEGRGTCTTYCENGVVAYQHRPLSSLPVLAPGHDGGS